jgi:surface antigen
MVMQETLRARGAMGRGRQAAVAALGLAMLAGCAGPGGGPGGGTAIGGLGGAAAGGLLAAALGGKATGIAAGTIIGGLLGAGIGSALDTNSQRAMNQSVHRSLESTPSGTASSWTNPDNGNTGTITPVRTFQNSQGAYCREFQQTVSIGGREERAYGTACRQPDGSWKVVS